MGIDTSFPTSALTVGSGAVNGTAITLNSPFATNNYADLIFSSGGTTTYNARIRATVPGDGTRKLEFITAKDAAENTVLTLDGDKNALFSGNVGIGTDSPNASALLDVQSTTKGVRFPNMTTTQKNAMADVAGMQVFDTTLSKMCFNTGSSWETITSS